MCGFFWRPMAKILVTVSSQIIEVLAGFSKPTQFKLNILKSVDGKYVSRN